jgi:hypothetical protein
MNTQYEKMQKLAFGKVTINESKEDLKQKIKNILREEMGVSEAKKKKSEPEEDEVESPENTAPQDDAVNVNIPDTVAPDHSAETDINPTVKSIQDSLQKAFAGAKSLGDAKLVTQIGNTITMLVRDQVLGGGQGQQQ